MTSPHPTLNREIMLTWPVSRSPAAITRSSRLRGRLRQWSDGSPPRSTDSDIGSPALRKWSGEGDGGAVLVGAVDAPVHEPALLAGDLAQFDGAASETTRPGRATGRLRREWLVARVGEPGIGGAMRHRRRVVDEDRIAAVGELHGGSGCHESVAGDRRSTRVFA
jgi:hypothetical protein